MARRILLLITDLEIGGTPTVVRELAIRLRDAALVSARESVEVEVACLSGWGPVADQLNAAGITVTALGGRRWIDLPIVLVRLVRLIRRGRFDTVFSFLVHANAVAAAASAFAPGVRFLQSIQTTQPTPRWHWRLQRLIQPAAEKVIVPSASAGRAAQDWAGVPAGRVRLIPNAVDVASFETAFIARGLARPPYRVGFIGRLDPIKRVTDLVEAVVGLDGFELHLYGDGPERPSIEGRVARLGLSQTVTLHGAISRPQEALAKIDVLVLASDAEGFGLVLIEAMAAGVPVVATDVPGIRDVVTHGVTGILVTARNPGMLRQAIVRACTDDAFRERAIPAARAEVVRRFSWSPVVAQYRSLLRIGEAPVQPA